MYASIHIQINKETTTHIYTQLYKYANIHMYRYEYEDKHTSKQTHPCTHVRIQE